MELRLNCLKKCDIKKIDLVIKLINSYDAIKAISEVRGDAIVVSIMTPNRYFDKLSTNKDLDLPVFGAMGKASNIALGISIAQPDKKVFVLDGDGSLLMNAGSLVTTAIQKPRNFFHFVFNDGLYTTTGGQPIPGAGIIDFQGLAKSCGYHKCFQFQDLEDFITKLPSIIQMVGPIFVNLKVFNDSRAPRMYMREMSEVMKNLRSVLLKN